MKQNNLHSLPIIAKPSCYYFLRRLQMGQHRIQQVPASKTTGLHWHWNIPKDIVSATKKQMNRQNGQRMLRDRMLDRNMVGMFPVGIRSEPNHCPMRNNRVKNRYKSIVHTGHQRNLSILLG